ncbi:MAG: VanW family protein [Acetivibrionales bacterium]|nr:VanW family protein [Bacillota bacterium]HOA54651.1 VanW family protein [Clostridiales bacterium]
MLRLITAILAAVYLINAQFVMTAPCSGTQPLGEDESSEFRGEGIDAEMASGPERNMPWINDSEFIEAVARNKTYVMLGGYKTVLKDPLPGEEYNVHLAADMLAGIVVKPGAIFSQNDAIGPYIESRGFRKGPTYIGTMVTTTVGGGVCKIASALYNVAVLSGVKITERHNHTMPVPYVPYGQDATVSYGNKDFKFMNTTDSDILIWAKGVDNVLYMAFYGSRPAPAVEWVHEVLETTKAPVVYRINTSLAEDEKRLLMEGMDGAVVKSWIRIGEGNEAEMKYMGLSRYQPMPHLIEKGPVRQ